MRTTLEETLEAEQHAARATAIRTSTLRDRAIELGDRAAPVLLHTAMADPMRGVLEGIGVDYLILTTTRGTRYVALHHVIAIEEAR